MQTKGLHPMGCGLVPEGDVACHNTLPNCVKIHTNNMMQQTLVYTTFTYQNLMFNPVKAEFNVCYVQYSFIMT
jgi:hypothetical protein